MGGGLNKYSEVYEVRNTSMYLGNGNRRPNELIRNLKLVGTPSIGEESVAYY